MNVTLENEYLKIAVKSKGANYTFIEDEINNIGWQIF